MDSHILQKSILPEGCPREVSHKKPCIPIPYTPVQRGRFCFSTLCTFVSTKELSQMGRPSQLNELQKSYPK